MAAMVWPWEGNPERDRQYQISYLRCDGEYRYPAHRHRGQWELVYVSTAASPKPPKIARRALRGRWR